MKNISLLSLLSLFYYYSYWCIYSLSDVYYCIMLIWIKFYNQYQVMKNSKLNQPWDEIKLEIQNILLKMNECIVSSVKNFLWITVQLVGFEYHINSERKVNISLFVLSHRHRTKTFLYMMHALTWHILMEIFFVHFRSTVMPYRSEIFL